MNWYLKQNYNTVFSFNLPPDAPKSLFTKLNSEALLLNKTLMKCSIELSIILATPKQTLKWTPVIGDMRSIYQNI